MSGYEEVNCAASSPSNGFVPVEEQILRVAFAELAHEASGIEQVAIELDRAGDAEQAVAIYQQAAERLARAAAACPEGNPDKPLLARHAGEVLGRVVYLESLGGAPATAPVEAHIGNMTLSEGQRHGPEAMDDGWCTESGSDKPRKPKWRHQAASAAAIGGATGLLVLHGPVAAVALAAGAAYATTRQDTAGQAARSVGDLGLEAAKKGKAFADEHQLPEKVTDAIAQVKALDERLGVSSRAQAVAAASVEALRDLDRRHQVSTKLVQGTASATVSVASATVRAAGWVSRQMASRR